MDIKYNFEYDYNQCEVLINCTDFKIIAVFDVSTKDDHSSIDFREKWEKDWDYNLNNYIYLALHSIYAEDEEENILWNMQDKKLIGIVKEEVDADYIYKKLKENYLNSCE
jgi:hypothetical protein